MHEVLDGVATDEEAATLRAHLADDADAREEFASWKGMFEGLASLPQEHPPEGLVAAIVAAMPVDIVPDARAEATRLDDAYAGERLAFIGTARRTGNGTTLARLAITCCRLDASPIAVRLDRAVAFRDGTWIDARGVLVRSESGPLVLHADAIRPIAAPADPFVYR